MRCQAQSKEEIKNIDSQIEAYQDQVNGIYGLNENYGDPITESKPLTVKEQFVVLRGGKV
jgi:hypothetical protein